MSQFFQRSGNKGLGTDERPPRPAGIRGGFIFTLYPVRSIFPRDNFIKSIIGNI